MKIVGRQLLLTNLSVAIVLVAVPAFATGTNESSQTFTYQGRFLNEGGTAPLDSVVDLTFGIYDPSGTCLLYEEKQSGIDLSTTSGMFSVTVGSAPGSSKRTSNDPAKAMSVVFKNSGSITATASCASGYTPAAGDVRVLRVTVTPQGGSAVVLTPDQTINGVPHSLVAETLQGKAADKFIQVTGNVSQTTMDTLTGGADASSLHNHDSLYAAKTAGGLVTIPSTASPSGAAGLYYNAGQLNYWDGSASKALLTSSLPAGTASAAPLTFAQGTNLTTAANGAMEFDGVNLYFSHKLTSGAGSATRENVCTYSGTPANGEVLAWNDTTKQWVPTVIGGSGTVTSVAAGAGLTGGTITSSGTLAVDVGTTAGKIVQLDGSARLPAVDGSQLTNVSVSNASVIAKVLTGIDTATQGVISATDSILGAFGKLQATKLDKTGDTMSGALTLSGAPSAANHASTKSYADSVASSAVANYLKKDGTVAMTGALDMGTQKINNVVDPAAAQDAATKAYVDARETVAKSYADDREADANGYTDTRETAIRSDLIAKTGGSGLGNLLLASDKFIGLGTHSSSPDTSGWGSADAGKTWYEGGVIKFWNGTTVQTLGVSGAGISSLTAGTGLTGGTITSSGTVAVDVGTTANKIVQLDGSARLPAVDGSQLTGLTVSQIPTLTVSKISDYASATSTAIGAATINGSQISGNISGNAANVTGTVAVANGGTGTTTSNANLVFAGPASGGAAAPGFRALAAADIPDLSGSYASASHAHTYASLTSKPTTLAGYGITDAAAKGANSDITSLTAVTALGSSGALALSSSSNGDISLTPNGTGKVSVASDLDLAASKLLGLGVHGSSPSVSGAGDTGKIWYQGGAIKFYDGSAIQTLGVSGAGITSLTAGTGLTGGTISTGGQTIAVDVGTTANKIVQLDGSAKLPAVDGSQLTGLSASQIPTLTVSKISDFSSATNTAIGAATINGSQVSGNISGNAANVTGTVAVANGGTGATTSNANLVFAGPSSGGAAAPGFRALAAADIPDLSGSYASASHAHTFASLTSTPTTLAGYGITDAAGSSHTHTMSGVTDLPAIVNASAGAGDAAKLVKTDTNGKLDSSFLPDLSGSYASAGHAHTFASLTSKPTTISGYGITDAAAKGANSDITSLTAVTALGSSGALALSSSSNGNITIAPNGTGVTAVTAGNVGIGISSSLAGKLHVKGSGNTSGSTVFALEDSSSGTPHFKVTDDGSVSMASATAASVGIGSASPRSKLDVAGSITSKAATSNGTRTVDWSLGNLQYTSLDCSSGFTFNNMKDGGSYTFAVQGTQSGTCAFTAYSGSGSGALTVKMPTDHAALSGSGHTVYTMLVMGSYVYVSWVTGI